MKIKAEKREIEKQRTSGSTKRLDGPGDAKSKPTQAKDKQLGKIKNAKIGMPATEAKAKKKSKPPTEFAKFFEKRTSYSTMLSKCEKGGYVVSCPNANCLQQWICLDTRPVKIKLPTNKSYRQSYRQWQPRQVRCSSCSWKGPTQPLCCFVCQKNLEVCQCTANEIKQKMVATKRKSIGFAPKVSTTDKATSRKRIRAASTETTSPGPAKKCRLNLQQGEKNWNANYEAIDKMLWQEKKRLCRQSSHGPESWAQDCSRHRRLPWGRVPFGEL